MSSFDFSLYLYPDTCLSLKNNASRFNLPKLPPSLNEKEKPRIEATVIYPSSSPRQTNRAVYYLEASKIKTSIIDIPITNGAASSNAEKFEYDAIESPQIFQSNLQVDWRLFNLVLWSKCYCPYDAIDSPTQFESQLSRDISVLKEDIGKACTKPSNQITLDTFQHV